MSPLLDHSWFLVVISSNDRAILYSYRDIARYYVKNRKNVPVPTCCGPWTSARPLCRRSAAERAASVTTVAMAVMEWAGLTVSPHALHSSVVDQWHELNSHTAQHYNSLIVTVWGCKPTSEQWNFTGHFHLSAIIVWTKINLVDIKLVNECCTAVHFVQEIGAGKAVGSVDKNFTSYI